MEKPEKLKLILLTSVLDKRGAERMILQLALGLDPERYDVKVVCLRSQTPFLDEFEARGVEVIVLGMKRYFELRPLVKLYRIFRDQRIDLVHTHLYRDAIYGRPIARLAGVRGVVSTLQNSYVWRSRAQLFLDRLTSAFADKVTVVSDAVKRFAIEREHIPVSKLVTIYNAIEPEKFIVSSGVREKVRRELGLAPDKIAVGSMGALTEQKGFGGLIEAIPTVLAVHPGVRFFIGGEGILKDDLLRQRDAAGLKEQVGFLGFRDDVAEVLSAFDIFVLPSLYEGLPLALVEAMAAGLPIVTTDVDGNCEAIGTGEAGIAVEPCDPPALARAILDLIADPQLRKKLGQRGRQRAAELFDVRVIVKRYEEIYRESLR